MKDYTEEKNILTEENLAEVAGGRKQPVGPGTGIQWDDPRCGRAATRAKIFGEEFRDCSMYSQAERERVEKLCLEFAKYVNTEEFFDLNMAKDIYIRIAGSLTYSMTVAATAGWKIFTRVFSDIFA